ncbi:MAG TPA: hypothetical protein VMZ27_14900 [Candidatus Saccharimonadales bacterium]|nr:hypothetical protein [Candidatus Saccharimonadales bacterium]
MQKLSTSLIALATCAFLALTATHSQAADKKANPTGTWTWSVPGRNGGDPRTVTLKLKTEGEKVTGKVSGMGRPGGQAPADTEITDGKLAGDELTFTVTREFNNNKFVQKYKGKVEGDTIKGKIEFERNGETQSRDWEAKRSTEKKEKEKE